MFGKRRCGVFFFLVRDVSIGRLLDPFDPSCTNSKGAHGERDGETDQRGCPVQLPWKSLDQSLTSKHKSTSEIARSSSRGCSPGDPRSSVKCGVDPGVVFFPKTHCYFPKTQRRHNKNAPQIHLISIWMLRSQRWAVLWRRDVRDARFLGQSCEDDIKPWHHATVVRALDVLWSRIGISRVDSSCHSCIKWSPGPM